MGSLTNSKKELICMQSVCAGHSLSWGTPLPQISDSTLEVVEKRWSSTKPGPKQDQIFKVKAIGFVVRLVMTLLNGYQWMVKLLSMHIPSLGTA